MICNLFVGVLIAAQVPDDTAPEMKVKSRKLVFKADPKGLDWAARGSLTKTKTGRWIATYTQARSVQDGSQALSRNSSATRFQATPNEYGAEMDGVTDDTAAFQDALNALADGGVLDISAGTALLSAPLTVKNKSCTIHGAGPFATILRWTSGNGIACSESRTKPQTNGDPTSWQITGCYFRGGRREGKTTSHHIHLTGNSTTFMIENCHGMISRYGILAEGVTEGVTISKGL